MQIGSVLNGLAEIGRTLQFASSIAEYESGLQNQTHYFDGSVSLGNRELHIRRKNLPGPYESWDSVISSNMGNQANRHTSRIVVLHSCFPFSRIAIALNTVQIYRRNWFRQHSCSSLRQSCGTLSGCPASFRLRRIIRAIPPSFSLSSFRSVESWIDLNIWLALAKR